MDTWTAVSFNWSTGLTTANQFLMPNHKTGKSVKAFFESKFPGEILLALIPGSFSSSIRTYPLKYQV